MRKKSIDRQHDDNEDQVHFIGEKSEPISRVMQSGEVFVDQQFQAVRVLFKSIKNQQPSKPETEVFQIEVQINKTNRVYQIYRTYADLQWLFNALNFSYPGCILPYFPAKRIEAFMADKLGNQYGEDPQKLAFDNKRDELQIFLNGVCSHSLLKQAEETKIFLAQSKEQFTKSKKAIEAQISESQSEQSSSNGILSIFERSVAWITSSNTAVADKIDSIKGWEALEDQIRMWINQYSVLIEKVQKLIEIKNSEADWKGPETEVDSVEQLKVRVVSGREFNKQFAESLRQNVIRNIQYEAKNLKQVEEQLQQRENIISIINYIHKFTTSNHRSNKLLRKKEKFETNLALQWPGFKESIKAKIRGVQKRFNEIWVDYCRKVQKIWRHK